MDIHEARRYWRETLKPKRDAARAAHAKACRGKITDQKEYLRLLDEYVKLEEEGQALVKEVVRSPERAEEAREDASYWRVRGELGW